MRAAIILAAGSSRRFGARDKMMAQLHGRSLLDLAIANAQASGARRIILVTSSRVAAPGVTVVHARDARHGLSASLAAGLSALRPIEREALIFLADMPFARAPIMKLTAGVDAVRPCFSDSPGHPMLVRVCVARRRLGGGDSGIGSALRTRRVAGSAGNIADIDTPAALLRARRHGSRVGGGRWSAKSDTGTI